MELQTKQNQYQMELQQQQVKMQCEIAKIASSIDTLTLQLNEFKPESGKELGAVRGEVSAEVSSRFVQTDENIIKLAEEMAKQSKGAEETSDTLQSLMISVENLGHNLIKMRNVMKS